MAIKNKTRYAILGILSLHSGTGYDIKKYCDTVIANFWNENFGHIYPVLNQLLNEGLIKTENSPSPRKKIYSITEQGRTDFLSWLIKPAEYQPVRSEFLLKLTFSSSLPKDNIISMLTDYRQMHHERLMGYKKIQNDLKKGITEITPDRELFLCAPLRYGILSTEAVIAWCDEVLIALRNNP